MKDIILTDNEHDRMIECIISGDKDIIKDTINKIILKRIKKLFQYLEINSNGEVLEIEGEKGMFEITYKEDIPPIYLFTE